MNRKPVKRITMSLLGLALALTPVGAAAEDLVLAGLGDDIAAEATTPGNSTENTGNTGNAANTGSGVNTGNGDNSSGGAAAIHSSGAASTRLRPMRRLCR